MTLGTGVFLEYRAGTLNHTIKAVTVYGATEPVLYHLRNANGKWICSTIWLNETIGVDSMWVCRFLYVEPLSFVHCVQYF